jgi:hypothetical protein
VSGRNVNHDAMLARFLRREGWIPHRFGLRPVPAIDAAHVKELLEHVEDEAERAEILAELGLDDDDE